MSQILTFKEVVPYVPIALAIPDGFMPADIYLVLLDSNRLVDG